MSDPLLAGKARRSAGCHVKVGCRVATLLAMTLFVITPAYPASKPDLKALQEKLAAEKSRKEELDRKADLQQKDLTNIKGSLVRTAGQVQSNEKNLNTLESQMAALKQKKGTLLLSLQADRKSLSYLIIALERIRRLPPETLLARPSAPRETAQAMTALGAILPELNKRATALRDKLDDLSAVEADLTGKHAQMQTLSAKLQTEQDKMDTLLATRSRTLIQTEFELQDQQKAVETASKEASDMQDLIDRINEQAKARSARREKSGIPDKEIALVPLPGAAQLPVSGIVRIRYGQQDEIGSTSEGISIEARSGAIVVAPMGGIVRYAGPFKSYGNIVLLEHKNNYHSLIAGLGKIDTVVGQSVDSGEPVGTLAIQSGDKPVLYYELRLNGQPINPARKFTDLGT